MNYIFFAVALLGGFQMERPRRIVLASTSPSLHKPSYSPARREVWCLCSQFCGRQEDSQEVTEIEILYQKRRYGCKTCTNSTAVVWRRLENILLFIINPLPARNPRARSGEHNLCVRCPTERLTTLRCTNVKFCATLSQQTSDCRSRSGESYPLESGGKFKNFVNIVNPWEQTRAIKRIANA